MQQLTLTKHDRRHDNEPWLFLVNPGRHFLGKLNLGQLDRWRRSPLIYSFLDSCTRDIISSGKVKCVKSILRRHRLSVPRRARDSIVDT